MGPRPRPQPVPVGVISDLHVGSSYCLRQAITEHVRFCYAAGARAVFVPGDCVDGESEDHGRYESKGAQGFDAQIKLLRETLPRLPGLTYYLIGGNHDGYALDRVGASTVAAACRGRADMVNCGERYGRVTYEGVVVDMWHPRSGAPGNSGPLHKRVDAYGRGDEPDLLLVGHFHKYAHVVHRGVHGFMCPSYQAGGSAFSNSLSSGSAVGGLLLWCEPGLAGRGLASVGSLWRAPVL